ncbi:hypothetical protein COOONC_19418 [Cooperia oncophora]
MNLSHGITNELPASVVDRRPSAQSGQSQVSNGNPTRYGGVPTAFVPNAQVELRAVS